MAAAKTTEDQLYTAMRWLRLLDLDPRAYDVEKYAKSIARSKPTTEHHLRELAEKARRA